MNDFNKDAEGLKLYFWIAAIGLSGCIFFYFGPTGNFMLPLCVCSLLLRPWQYVICKAILIGKQFEVCKRNWLLGSKSYLFDLSRLDFTYRTTPIRLVGNGVHFTPNTGNVRMLFYDDHLLFDLTPDKGGWTDEAIRQLAKELKAHGVTQTLEKYGSNDVLNF